MNRRTELHRGWSAGLPLGLVLVSLLALALLPVLIERRLDRYRDEISDVAEPARGLLTEIQLAIALEVAGARGFLLTGEEKFVRSYHDARIRRRQAQERLLPLATQLGPGLADVASQLANRLRPVDESVDALLDGRVSRSAYLERLDEQQRRLETIVGIAAQLDEETSRVAVARRSRIQATEHVGVILATVLVVLALLSASLVARLGRRYRSVALQLDESEERFRQIAENINQFIWLRDPQFTTYLYANAAYERIWGRRREDLLQDPGELIEGVHPDDRDRVRTALAALPHGDYDIEFRVMRPDGEIRWVWSLGFPVRNERGEIFRIAGISEDITERKLGEIERHRLLERERTAREEAETAQAAAEERRSQLERVTESRARLIRGFTHDVKNPLGAADGFLALLEDGILGELSGTQKRSVAKVRRSIRAALDLIRHLLDLARAEAGHLETQRVVTDMGAIAHEVAEEFSGQAEGAGLVLDVELSGETPVIESDPARARQVLANLVSNAIKYTPKGGHVTVRVDTRHGGAAPRPGDWVVTEVCDTGHGIAPDKQATLFLEFTRFDPGAAQGAGIGLAISQRVAHALGGAITVDSEVDKGSTFAFWLPLVRSDAEETEEAVGTT